ncbi:MAG: hypothetical protein Q7K43_05070, partial [Candidatus Woesearchaeota archaeon]|nr:hypothetical protein [Candidatus Woesearchaeota archaeon]
MSQLTQAHTPIIHFLDNTVYWTGVGLAILANFLLSVALIPFLLAIKGVWLYLAIIFIALSFGTVLDAVLRMVQRISQQQVIAELFIPVLALINIYVIAGLTNTLSAKIGLNTVHNAWMISVVYVVAFSLPHFVVRLLKQKIDF